MVFLRLSGIPRIGTLHTCSPYMEPFQTSHRRRYSNDYRSCMDHLFILYPGCARRNSFHTCNRNRMGFLYNQLCASYNGYIPYFHMHQSSKSPTNSNRSIKTQLWHVSHAYILARVVVTVFKHTLALPTVAAIPCIAVSTFICCFVTAKIISFIPGSKWIIG